MSTPPPKKKWEQIWLFWGSKMKLATSQNHFFSILITFSKFHFRMDWVYNLLNMLLFGSFNIRTMFLWMFGLFWSYLHCKIEVSNFKNRNFSKWWKLFFFFQNKSMIFKFLVEGFEVKMFSQDLEHIKNEKSMKTSSPSHFSILC